MKLSSVRKIVLEDYPDTSRDVVQRLAQTLNPFLDQISTAMGSQLTLSDNLKGKVYQNVKLGEGVYTKILAWDVNEKPLSVTIGNLALQGGAAPAAAFSLSWILNSKGLNLTFLGLDPAAAHVATIIALV